MAVFWMTRYEIRPEAREDAERAMHEFASYVRRELPGSAWTTYRDIETPTRYIALGRAEHPSAHEQHLRAAGTQTFQQAVRALLAVEPAASTYELVTSSDLAPRHRSPPPPRRGRPRR